MAGGLLVVGAFASAQQPPQLPDPPTTQPVDQAGRPVDQAGEPGAARRVVARRAVVPTPGDAAPNQAPPQLPALHHPWARFRPGAWRRVRTTTESFDANGRFLGRSTTSQTETLTEVNKQSYSLEVVSIVEVGGKRLRGASQTMTYPLLCDQPCDAVQARHLGTANIALDGAVAPVERWSLRYGAAGDQRLETVCYSADRSPYVLRREIRSAEESNGPQTTISVTRVDAPLLLDGGILPTAHVSVVTRSELVKEDRFEVRCDAVPGGLVSASSTERDASGRRVRWSAVELEDFGESPSTVESDRRWRPLRRIRKWDREQSS